MKIKIWGCRGSIPSPGAEKNIYGGNTSCVQIIDEQSCIILDGGSGVQNLGASLGPEITEINILLTHLHIDHIVGLGFFQPFYNPNVTINIWGPATSKEPLAHRLKRYFSPPIFPVRISELPCHLNIYEISQSKFKIGNFNIISEYVCHPGPTIGYRIEHNGAVLAYMPDHEPALGSAHFPNDPEWTSGYTLANNADLILHDSQYKPSEYESRVGWGHCSMEDALKFGNLAGVKKMLLFHHDPLHSDTQLKNLFEDALKNNTYDFEVDLAKEGEIYSITA